MPQLHLLMMLTTSMMMMSLVSSMLVYAFFPFPMGNHYLLVPPFPYNQQTIPNPPTPPPQGDGSR